MHFPAALRSIQKTFCPAKTVNWLDWQLPHQVFRIIDPGAARCVLLMPQLLKDASVSSAFEAATACGEKFRCVSLYGCCIALVSMDAM